MEFFWSFSDSAEQRPESEFGRNSPRLLGAQSSFSEQVSVHLQLVVVVEIPAEFWATTCFPSAPHKLRGAIQSSKTTLRAKCVRRRTHTLCTQFKAAHVLFLIAAHGRPPSAAVFTLKYLKLTSV